MVVLATLPGQAARRIESFFPIEPLWTLALNGSLLAAPAFDSAHAYFLIEGDRLAAYDLAEGKLAWTTEIVSDQSPIPADDLVYVVQARAIAALHAADGTPAWTVPFAERLAVPLVWDTGWLVAATAHGDLQMRRASNGELIWKRDLGSPAHASPSLAGDRVYVSTEDGRILALKIESGEPIWARRLGGAGSDILALSDRVFVGSRDNYFYCLRSDDGARDWRWRTGADVLGMPAVDEHNVYFVALDNIVRGLNRGHGVQQWMQPLAFRPTAGPIKAMDTLIVSGLPPAVPAFNVTDGKSAGNITAAGELAAPPYLFKDKMGTLQLLVTTRDVVKGAVVTAYKHSTEPALLPIAPLPGATLPPAPKGTPAP